MSKFITAVSMEVTEEQYNRDLKKQLQELGYIQRSWIDFHKWTYIVTNWCNENNGYSFSYIGSCEDRYFIDHYNPELFLALAAMSDEKYGVTGEYWKYINDNSDNGQFTYNKLYKGIIPHGQYFRICGNKGDVRNFISNHNFVKATKEEIISFLSKGYKTEVCVIPDKWCLEPIIDINDGKLVCDWLNIHKDYDNPVTYAHYGTTRHNYVHFPPPNQDRGPYLYSGIQKGYTKISIEEFKKYILKQEINTMEEFITTRQSIQEIYNIACATWKPKLVEMIEKYSTVFSNEITLPYSQIKSMFDAATKEQLIVLKKVFPEYKKDKNAFIDKFTSTELNNVSKRLFGNSAILQIATNSIAGKRPDLNGRALYISSDYKVNIISLSTEDTIIEITKK